MTVVTEERISEAPWDGSPSRFTDEEYESSCAMDRGSSWADKPVQRRCDLPIREPNGELSRAAVHAAAEQISKMTTDIPGVMEEAKDTLRAAYQALGEDVPDSIKEIEREDLDPQLWGVPEGEARHGEEALRAISEADWQFRSDTKDGNLGVLNGHFAVFRKWTEIDSFWEGRFLESIAPGAFTKTFDENAKNIRCLFQHGRDPQVGMKPLGTIRTLDQDETGARYDVDLFDTSYNRDLLPGLKTGQYGASFRFQVIREEVNTKPERSEYNPEAIEERTIVEARVREFGPVTFGAYEEATAGIRSFCDQYWDLAMARSSNDPERLAHFLHQLHDGGERRRTQVPVVEPPPETKTAPSTTAPEQDPPRVGPKRSTHLSGAARTLRTSRKLEEPSWRL